MAKSMNYKECDYYDKGKCDYGCGGKCSKGDKHDCPLASDYYDPYFEGDIEEW